MNLRALLWKNPILVKEVRTRMRGKRAFMLVTAHLLVLAFLITLVYFSIQSSLSARSTIDERRLLGKVLFGFVIGSEMVMVSFVAPTLTSGSISLERERQTYDLLRVTTLPAHTIVIGKYLSGLIFIFLLLFTSIPFQSPAFLLGGVATEELFLGFLILSVTSLTFCIIGLFLSCTLSRTLLATALSYGLAIFLAFGIPLIVILVLIIMGSRGELQTLQSNIILQTTLLLLAWLVISFSPTGAIIGTEMIWLDQKSILMGKIPLSNGTLILLPSPWIPFVFIYCLTSIILLIFAVRLLNRVDK